MTWKCERALLFGMLTPSGKGREANPEVMGGSTWANVFTGPQFDSLAFELCGLGLSGRRAFASYAEGLPS